MQNDFDKLLLTAVASGDKEAFRLVFGRYYPKALAMLRGMLKDDFLAEETAQDLFMNLWLRRAQLAAVKSLDSYLYAAVRNGALGTLRRTRRTVPLDKAAETAGGNSAAEEPLLLDELRRRVGRELEKMPAQRRKVFVMSRMNGLSAQEIAEELGISKRTVERHIGLALEALRKIELVVLILLTEVN